MKDEKRLSIAEAIARQDRIESILQKLPWKGMRAVRFSGLQDLCRGCGGREGDAGDAVSCCTPDREDGGKP